MNLLGMLLLGFALGIVFAVVMCKFWDKDHSDGDEWR